MTTRRDEHFPVGKHGPEVDPVGEYVTLLWDGRPLIGEVVGVRYDETGYWRCTVKHFCGDYWPIEPILSALDWIRRDSGDGFAASLIAKAKGER